MDFGKYVYDIQYSKTTGEVVTIVPGDPMDPLPSFRLSPEVTYE